MASSESGASQIEMLPIRPSQTQPPDCLIRKTIKRERLISCWCRWLIFSLLFSSRSHWFSLIRLMGIWTSAFRSFGSLKRTKALFRFAAPSLLPCRLSILRLLWIRTQLWWLIWISGRARCIRSFAGAALHLTSCPRSYRRIGPQTVGPKASNSFARWFGGD